MQIIKDQQIVDDNWRFISDEEELIDGNICVSLARWNKDKQQLIKSNEKVGIRLSPNDSIDDISPYLKDIELIELNFPAFTDGRSFSQAWLLRSRYNFQGEIRATGRFMPDQAFYLSRVGVNAFKPDKAEDLPLTISTLKDFTVKYQQSIR